MAAFYLDSDVSFDMVPLLQAAGHQATAAQSLGLRAAMDDEQLLTAAARGWVLVTHNYRDFALLHAAWLRWSSAWRVASEHAGILMIPQPRDLPLAQAARELANLVGSGQPLTNELYRRHPRGARDQWLRWRLDIGWTYR